MVFFDTITVIMLDLGFKVIALALLGGIVPALFWLWFWLKEDAENPEPPGILLLTFLIGMVAVIVVLPLQKVTNLWFGNEKTLVVVWAALEEILKYGGVALVALRSKHCNEPIDYAIYMITGALGFAALENALFLVNPIGLADTAVSLLTGNLRFLGSMLLHVVASGVIGMFIGFAYHRNWRIRDFAFILAMGIAITLHSIFNFLIIKEQDNLFNVFILLWGVSVVFIFFFERLRRISNRGKKSIV